MRLLKKMLWRLKKNSKFFLAVFIFFLCYQKKVDNIRYCDMADLLKEGAKHLTGLEEAIFKNCEAILKLSDIVRTSLGPNGISPFLNFAWAYGLVFAYFWQPFLIQEEIEICFFPIFSLILITIVSFILSV